MPKFNRIALTYFHDFGIDIPIKQSITSSTSSFSECKNLNTSETKLDISKMQTSQFNLISEARHNKINCFWLHRKMCHPKRPFHQFNLTHNWLLWVKLNRFYSLFLMPDNFTYQWVWFRSQWVNQFNLTNTPYPQKLRKCFTQIIWKCEFLIWL